VNRVFYRVAVVSALVSIGLAVVLIPRAQSQVQVAPSYIPIGVAASGASSTAWFHQPSSGRVLACLSVPGNGAASTSIQCVAAKLP